MHHNAGMSGARQQASLHSGKTKTDTTFQMIEMISLILLYNVAEK
jgi:hypothetical protein